MAVSLEAVCMSSVYLCMDLMRECLHANMQCLSLICIIIKHMMLHLSSR